MSCISHTVINTPCVIVIHFLHSYNIQNTYTENLDLLINTVIVYLTSPCVDSIAGVHDGFSLPQLWVIISGEPINRNIGYINHLGPLIQLSMDVTL